MTLLLAGIRVNLDTLRLICAAQSAQFIVEVETHERTPVLVGFKISSGARFANP